VWHNKQISGELHIGFRTKKFENVLYNFFDYPKRCFSDVPQV